MTRPNAFKFGDYEIDHALYELRARGSVVKIEPKVFDVLAYLITHRDRVVTKDDLLGALWPDESVSESVLPRCIAAARRAVGRAAIQTLHGRGYRFVAAGAEASGAVAPPGSSEHERSSGVFVGRAAIMTDLEGLLGEIVGGHGRLALLVGEPGIGKTRTADELAARARARNVAVLLGRCHEGEGAPAFWPWVQVLRSLVDDRAGAGLAADLGAGAADIAQLVPELRESIAVPPPPSITAEQARFRLFDSVTGFLKRASAARPLMIVLDDLHWADTPSLLLLKFLAREMRAAHLLVLGTYRDVELNRRHPLAEVLGELSRESLYHRVPLRGLGESDVGHMIALVGDTAPRPALVSAVHEMTDGNPFFVGEIVRLLAAEERLVAANADTALEIGLPQGIREAIGRRLTVLSDECNRVLGLAAMIGREFALPILERVSGVGADPLLDVLDEAVSARIIGPVADHTGGYRFSHALIRETLYEELSTPLRVRLHRQIGSVMVELHATNLGPHLAEIAHHFFQGAPGGGEADAVAYACRAAERALQLLAYEAAAAHYGRALQAMELGSPVDEIARIDVMLKLGEAQSRAGERDAARGTFQDAANLARTLGRPDFLAQAAIGFGGRAEFGVPRDEPLLALLDEAARALGSGHDALRARLLSRLVGTAPYSESMEKRRELSDEAVTLARRDGDPATLAEALNARHWALLGPDHVVERREIGAEMMRLAERAGDRNAAFLAYNHEYDAVLEIGDMSAADHVLETLASLATELRQPIEQWFVAWFRAGRAMANGRFDEAEREIEQGRMIGRQAQHPVVETAFAGQSLWLAGERGELITREGLEDFKRNADFIVRTMPTTRFILRAAEVEVCAGLGFEAEARPQFEALAAHDFADLPRDEHWIVTLWNLSESAALLGDQDRAALLYDLLRPYADRNAVHSLIRTSRGSVAHCLGRLASARGQFAAADRHFRSALAMNRRMRMPPIVARTESEYAGMLLERGRAEDRRRARELLASAATATRNLGMASVGRQVEELSGRLRRATEPRSRRT